MYVGVDYYPEHWPRERWETDARMMQEAGFNIVRLAEFAWIFMEPEEGRFTFDLFDEALGILRQHGISAIMCTPTAAMPAWVPRKYPEVMAMRPDGSRIVWGIRKNNCFSSGAYRLLSERVTRAMAEHFAATPNVIGWQTDNEFGHPVCYCPTCRSEFQDWLRRKYGTVDALNAAWGAHFWGHSVTRWEEVVIPTEPQGHNPSALLDWQRFFSWLNVRFQRDQVHVLREACPQHFVTHNFMGLFADLNYYDLAEDLDFVSWDNYPVWGKPEIPYAAAAAADVMRGLKRQNFWIMEQTAGPGGWATFGRTPRPGELRKVAYQQLAHGADAQVWFRWRTCTAGREQYWHGLLGHDGRGLRRYREAAQVAEEYHRLADDVAGTTVEPQVAMVYDYESLWALRFQPGFPGNDYHAAMHRYYNALLRAGVNVDMVRPTQDLSPYRLVLAPDLFVLPDPVAERLAAYVQAGGVLLADGRTGVKDENNLAHARTLPGLLSEPLGITIEEYETMPESVECRLTGPLVGHRHFSAHQYADWLTPQGAEALAGYESWYLEPYAALTRHQYGQGAGYYLGTVVQEPEFYDALIAELLGRAGVTPLVKPPVGMEVSVRSGGGKKLLFLVNHTEQELAVQVPAGGTELVSGREVGGSVTLGVYEVAVVRL
jgi:beta-galactosidase